MSAPEDTTAAGPAGPARPPVLALVGPTGVGKTELSLRLAARGGFELLSMDSMLVYRGLDVGTAKPGPRERARTPHHLLDLVEPTEDFTVARWLGEARAAERAARARGARPLYVGGTFLYLKALVDGLFDGPPVDRELRARLEARYASEGAEVLHAELARVDPASAARIHPNDRKRLVRALEVEAQTGRPLSSFQDGWHDDGPDPGRPRRLVGLTRDPADLERRIRARAEAMLDSGWAEEARRLARAGGLSRTATKALGYAEVLALAEGELDRGACLERIAQRTRQFARRQRTWLRRFPDLVWIELGPEENEDLDERVDQVLALFGGDPG